MSLNPAEISKLIKAQIQNIDQDLEMSESGTVITIGDGIAMVYGLRNAMMSELLLFPHDVYGMVMNLEECILRNNLRERLKQSLIMMFHREQNLKIHLMMQLKKNATLYLQQRRCFLKAV